MNELMNLYRNFLNRTDDYAIQEVRGEECSYYRRNSGVRYASYPSTITDELLRYHIDGKLTIGVYQLDNNGYVTWLCWDFDGDVEETKKSAIKLRNKLDAAGMHSFIEFSGKKGWHVWVFIEKTDVKYAYVYAKKIAEGFDCETFPKNKECKEFGNLVKLPLGIHAVTGKRSYFLDPMTLKPMSQDDAINLLLTNELHDVIPKEEIAETTKTPTALATGAKGAMPKEIEYLVTEGVGEGKRNDARFTIFSKLKYKGWSDDEILDVLQTFNKNCRPPNDKSKITAQWQQMVREWKPQGQTAVNENIKDVPLKDLVDFSKFDYIFENTHSHLPVYDILDRELGLIGKPYYPIKKALCYFVESIRQKTINFVIGTELGDNRIHLAEMVMSGRGKGQQRKAINRYQRSMYEKCATIQPSRMKQEQLVGKIISSGSGKNKKTVEEKGYFGYKVIIADECQTLLTEEEATYAALMVDFRNAMDVYGNNLVEKKLVNERMMSLTPETRFFFLSHPIKLPPRFFDLGTFRRMFMFEITDLSIDESAGWASLIAKPTEDKFKNYINTPIEQDGITFPPEAVEELIEWIRVWNHFALTNENQRIRAIAQKHFTSVKQLFIRLSAILAITRGEKTVSADTVSRACMDGVQFLLSTYQLYANESTINLSRDVWKSDDPKVASVFEWMWFNNALSEENTLLGISDVQEFIGDTFGLLEKQSRRVFRELVEAGLIGRSKGQHSSKAWLTFRPQLDEVELKLDKDCEGLEPFLKRKSCYGSLSTSGGKHEK